MAKSSEVFGDARGFSSEMKNIINDQEFSDITFVVGETREKIYAHRVILAARCEVFRAMFSEQKTQKKDGTKLVPLVLPDVRPSVFLAVLEFVYCNSCTLKQATVVDVLASAIEYGLDGLADCCSSYIEKNLSVDTACPAMQAAIAYNQPELQAHCMSFIEKNTRSVLKSKQMVEMSAETFAHILKSDELTSDEKDILDAVKEWANVNAVVSGQTPSQVLKGVIDHVRFPLLDSDTLHALEAQNEKDNTIPVRLIAKAWKFKATNKADASDPHFKPRKGTVS